MGLFSKGTTEDKVEKKDQKKTETVKGGKKTDKKTDDEVIGSGYGVIIAPIVTEKSHQMTKEGKYLFKVFPKVTKKEIKKTIERMYSVNVIKVNVSIVSKKKRTIKYDKGYQKAYKKAIVTLKKGQSISAFDGV